MKDPARLIFTEEPHGYSLDGFPIPSVSAVLAGAGYTPPFTDVPDYVLKRASYRGTIFHRATVCVEKGLAFDFPADLEPDDVTDLMHRLSEFERFLADEKPGLEAAEESGFHEGCYIAGTWDRLYAMGPDPERKALLDIKTSSKPSPWWAIQLALYNLIEAESYPKAPERFALWFPKKGKYQLIPARELSRRSDLEDYADAIAACKTYHYRVRHGLIEGITRP